MGKQVQKDSTNSDDNNGTPKSVAPSTAAGEGQYGHTDAANPGVALHGLAPDPSNGNPDAPFVPAQARQMADVQEGMQSGRTPNINPLVHDGQHDGHDQASRARGNRSGVIDGINEVDTLEDGREKTANNRQYRVIGGPDSVMYNGQRIRLTPGKILTEHSVDIEHLQKQGVQVQLIPHGKV